MADGGRHGEMFFPVVLKTNSPQGCNSTVKTVPGIEQTSFSGHPLSSRSEPFPPRLRAKFNYDYGRQMGKGTSSRVKCCSPSGLWGSDTTGKPISSVGNCPTQSASTAGTKNGRPVMHSVIHTSFSGSHGSAFRTLSLFVSNSLASRSDVDAIIKSVPCRGT